jgi:hypothetical protein
MRQLYSTELAIVSGILIVLAAIIFAIVQTPFTTDDIASANPTPHPLQGWENCSSCHGPDGTYPYPSRHLGWSDRSCFACHPPAKATATAKKGSGRQLNVTRFVPIFLKRSCIQDVEMRGLGDNRNN